MMATGGSVKQTGSVLVIYHDSSFWMFQNEVLPVLKDNGFKTLTLENDGMPGNLINKNFIDLAKSAGKILFIISKEFKLSPILQNLTTFATNIVPPENIVCLFINCDKHLEDTFSCLVGTNSLYISGGESLEEWKQTLLDHLSKRRPKYCHFMGPAKVSSDLQYIPLNTYQIVLKHKDEHFRIDQEKLQSHIGQDGHHCPSANCEECSKLCPEDTSVSIVYDDLLEERQNEKDECLRLSCEISKVWNPNSNIKDSFGFPIACKINGILRNLKFVRVLFFRICLQLFSVLHVSNQTYCTYESRLASFPSSWSEEKAPTGEMLAKAGFYYVGRPHVTCCHCCGLVIFDWSPDDNPLYVHAGRSGECLFITDTLPEDRIKSAQDSCVKNEYKTIEGYSSYESRKQSCESFLSEIKSEVKVDVICRSGFYFTGIGLLFACFACGIILPYTEANIKTSHARFSPTCNFMKSAYGEDYIRDICSAADNDSSRTILTIYPNVVTGHQTLNQFKLPKHCFMFIPSKTSYA